MLHVAEPPQASVLDERRRERRARAEDLFSALTELAYNLHWSWDPATAEIFRSLAPLTWPATHNPVAVLRAVRDEPDVLESYRARILEARQELHRYLRQPPRRPGAPRVAYFSAEFAITECLPIYSGGLGVLAGDHLKAASDLGLPLAGVGLLYH